MKKAFDAAEQHQNNFRINPIDSSDISKYSFGYLNRKYDAVSDGISGEYSSNAIRDVYVTADKTVSFNDDCTYYPCFASDFSMFILDLIENNYIGVNEEGCIDSSFYELVSVKGEMIADMYGIYDSEMIKIFTKQLILILKSMNHIDLSLGRVKITEGFKCDDLTVSLFRTFWNNVRWADLFPSLPDLADSLQKNRTALSGMLLQSEYPVHLEKVGFEFLVKSNVRLRNEMLLISFLDFSIFSWLNLFGFIKYLDQNCGRCVMIDLTDYGRRSFSAL